MSTQNRILEFIRNFIESNKYPPTYREIMEGCNVSSTSVVSYHVKALVEEGALTRDPGLSRTLVPNES